MKANDSTELFIKIEQKLARANQAEYSLEVIFLQIVDPLFTGMALLSNDYFLMLQEASEYQTRASKIYRRRFTRKVLYPLYYFLRWKSLRVLRDHRDRFLVTRQHAQTAMSLLRDKCESQDVKWFAESIFCFFDSTQVEIQWGGLLSEPTDAVEIFDLIESKRAGAFLNTVQENFEKNWTEITRAYAKLRFDQSQSAA